MIMLLHDFHDSPLICDKYPLSKTQSILRGRLTINRNAGQFGLLHSAVM